MKEIKVGNNMTFLSGRKEKDMSWVVGVWLAILLLASIAVAIL